MQKNKKSMWLYIGIFVLLLIAVYAITSQPDKKKKISYTEFYDKMYAGEVAEIDVYGDTIRIRAVDGVDEDKFPKKLDYYCTFMSVDGLMTDVREYNEYARENNADPANAVLVIVEANYQYEGESVISSILPYLSIGLMIVFAVIIFKSFMGSKSSGPSFGRSKARLVMSSKVKFADVAGAEEEKEELKELVEFLKNPQRFISLGARIPKGVLLVGQPGTGKTLFAKAVAGESNVPFFSITGSDFVEMYVGVGASRVRDLFDQAKRQAPCIIFIDEIDAVGRQRGAGLGGGNDEREQTLNQLLVEMDGFEPNEGIIVLAATNRADVLDPALLRPGRFDRRIYVHMPDVKGREEIIKIYAKNKPIDQEIDFKRLARLTSGMSGADIENFLNEAAILAARDHRATITMKDITEGINKALMGPQKKSRVISTEDKRITALHEGGHAIVAKTLPMCDKVQEISIVPRGDAGGYTLTLDEKDATHITKEKLLQMITMMLGGRAAESVILEDVTTGASNDMQRATQLARRMVSEWGMSDNLGLMSLNNDGEVFIGRDYQKQTNYSENIASLVDAETKKIIDACFDRAKAIVTEHKDVLLGLIDLLLSKETIYSEEFDMLCDGKTVAEVISEIDKKEKRDKKRHDKQRAEARATHLNKDIQMRLQTAEALHKAGVINDKDYENVVSTLTPLLEEDDATKATSKPKTARKSKKADENKDKGDK